MKTNELKCTDLRIGNLIKYEDKLVQVVQLSSLMILCQRDENQFLVNCAPKVFQPIELTEEVLLKIGFEKFVKSFRMELSECRLDYFINKSLYIYKKHTNCCLIKDLEIKCEFLHELQNAYYCLTGEDLNIEL